jgi:hypothetical protein
MAIKSNPETADTIVRRLVEFWKTQEAQRRRKESKVKKKAASEEPPAGLTADQAEAWRFFEIGKAIKDLGQIQRVVAQIFDAATETPAIKQLRKVALYPKSSTVDKDLEGDKFFVCYYGDLIENPVFLKAMVSAWEMIKEETAPAHELRAE